MGWHWHDGGACGGGGGEGGGDHGDVSWVEVAIYSWNCPVKSPTYIHTQLHTHIYIHIPNVCPSFTAQSQTTMSYLHMSVRKL